MHKTLSKLNTLGILVCVITGLSACSHTAKPQQALRMDPSWDADGDGINDCEKDASCDHDVDYRLPRPSPEPSFSCVNVELATAEKRICQSHELAMLDVRLAKVFKQALAVSKEPSPGPSFLQAEQRGWIKGRNECWQSEVIDTCISERYQKRIAQLQARYRLVESHGPFRFQCSDSPADELVVTYFDTDPKTLISERGDTVSLMYQTPSASGIKYLGRNESFWQHQHEVMLEWGENKAPLHCQQIFE